MGVLSQQERVAAGRCLDQGHNDHRRPLPPPLPPRYQFSWKRSARDTLFAKASLVLDLASGEAQATYARICRGYGCGAKPALLLLSGDTGKSLQQDNTGECSNVRAV